MYCQGPTKYAKRRASSTATVASHSSSGSPSPRNSIGDASLPFDNEDDHNTDHPNSLDGPLSHVFANGEPVWVRTSSGVWVFGTVNYRLGAPRTFPEKAGAGICYMVTMPKPDDLDGRMGERWASWFAPSEGTIWPDCWRVRHLLKSQGAQVPQPRPKRRKN